MVDAAFWLSGRTRLLIFRASRFSKSDYNGKLVGVAKSESED